MSLYRSQDEQLLFGVCAGIAESLRVPPIAVRIAFVLLGLTWGLGVVAYVLLALLMDAEAQVDGALDRDLDERFSENGRALLDRLRDLASDLRDALRRVLRGEGEDAPRQRQLGVALLIGGLLLVLGSLGLLAWVSVPVLVGGAALGFGLWLLLGKRDEPPEP